VQRQRLLDGEELDRIQVSVHTTIIQSDSSKLEES
jgi:hypothetical protein